MCYFLPPALPGRASAPAHLSPPFPRARGGMWSCSGDGCGCSSPCEGRSACTGPAMMLTLPPPLPHAGTRDCKKKLLGRDERMGGCAPSGTPGKRGAGRRWTVTEGLCWDGGGGWCATAVLSRTMETLVLAVGWWIPLGHGRRWLKMEGPSSPNPPALLPPRHGGVWSSTHRFPAFPEASSAGASQMPGISRRDPHPPGLRLHDPSPILQLQPSHCEYLKPAGAVSPRGAGLWGWRLAPSRSPSSCRRRSGSGPAPELASARRRAVRVWF